MRKYIITFCLMLLCLITFGSRAYAVFITNITEFVQYDGTDTFTDSFDDGAEPPVGPSGTSTYLVEGTFGSGRESGGSLKLDSDDGIVDVNDKEIAAAVKDSTYFFSAGSGGYVRGTFDFSGGGLPPDSPFGIEILNFASTVGGEISGDPVADDEAWTGVYLDSGHLFGVWGDESQSDPLGSQDLGLVSTSIIEMKLEIGASNQVSAFFDYGSFSFSVLNFSGLSFIPDDVYTGGFAAAGEIIVPDVPEPATVALLGIGLAGLAGAVVRRRLKKAKQQ